MADASAPAYAKQLERRIWIRIWLANLVGGIPVNIYFTLGSRYFDFRIDISSRYAILPIAVYLPAYFYTRWRSRNLFNSYIAPWVVEGRPPTESERTLTITHPKRLALMSLWWWVWALFWSFVVGMVVFEPLGYRFIGIFTSVTLSALIACSLTYIVSEDALRPLFKIVLADDRQGHASVGIMPRLTLTWLLGSASYFIAITMVVLTLPASALPGYILGACVFAVLVGATLTIYGARSVARPLDEVKGALASVEQGDLSASVPVNDAGEIGQLQSGFNRMVSGLRERDRLRELFERHVGPDVAERAVSSTGLAGAQVDATVLFADMIGSTTLAAERPPQAVVAMLNAFFTAVVRIVGAEGGLVNQFQGDGAVCLFGAPLHVDDHAARALRAATALRREIVSLGDVYPGFDAAVGVSSGMVVCGDVGTEDRYEYTVIGDAANEASRLTDEAKQRPARLLVSEGTITAAGVGGKEWLSTGELRLRGRPLPTTVYEPA